ncbi:MAG: hypothetical protein SOW55_07320 [Bacilli bacterium]|nr:hypothetical protein [Bacilli bacterium]
MGLKNSAIIVGSLAIAAVSSLVTFFSLSASGVIEKDKEKLVVDFKTPSYVKEYSGEYFNADDIDFSPYLSSGSLKNNCRYEISYSGQQKEVGTTKVEPKMKIYDEKDSDITDNYSISFAQTPSIIVTQRELTINVNKEEVSKKNTNSEDLYSFVSGSLVNGEEIDTIFNESEGYYTISQVIYDSLGNDVTSNYLITLENVKIDQKYEISYSELVIKLKDVEKTYDGKPVEIDYEIVSGKLKEGHKVEFTFDGEEIIDVDDSGEYEFNKEKFIIVDKDGKNVTKQYENIQLLSGTITINPIEVNAYVPSMEKDYDGKPFDINIKLLETLPENYVVSLNDSDKKEIDSFIETGKKEIIFSDFVVKFVKGNKEEVTSNYKVSGIGNITSLVINKKQVEVTFDNFTKVYDGKEITDEEIKKSIKLNVGDIDVEKDITIPSYCLNLSEIIDAGKYEFNVNLIMDNKNYEFEILNSLVITIDPKPLALEWVGSEFTYNGKYQVPKCRYYGEDGPIYLDVEGKQVDAGEYTATAILPSDNYTVKKDSSITHDFTIKAKEVELIWDNTSVFYNGKYQVPTCEYLDENGDEVFLEVEGKQINAGTYTAKVNVSPKNYILQGTSSLECIFTINSLPIGSFLTWEKDNVEYNGLPQIPLCTLKYNVVDYPIEVEGAQTNAGTYFVKAIAPNDNFIIEPDKVTHMFVIKPKAVSLSWDTSTPLIYNGKEQAPICKITLNGEEKTLEVKGKGINAGTYTAIAVLPSDNYICDDLTFDFSISPYELDPSSLNWSNTSLTYNGEYQVPTCSMTLVDGTTQYLVVNGKEIAANDLPYIAEAVLPNNNYTCENLTCEFTISRQQVQLIWGDSEFTYNGKYQVPTCHMVTSSGVFEINVNGEKIDAGNYTATAVLPNNYACVESDKNHTFNISKLSLTFTPITYKFSKAFLESGKLSSDMINVIQLTGESAKVFGEYVVCNISNMNFSSISTNDVIDIETINLEDVFDAKNVEFPSGTTVIGYIVVTAI